MPGFMNSAESFTDPGNFAHVRSDFTAKEASS